MDEGLLAFRLIKHTRRGHKLTSLLRLNCEDNDDKDRVPVLGDFPHWQRCFHFHASQIYEGRNRPCISIIFSGFPNELTYQFHLAPL